MIRLRHGSRLSFCKNLAVGIVAMVVIPACAFFKDPVSGVAKPNTWHLSGLGQDILYAYDQIWVTAGFQVFVIDAKTGDGKTISFPNGVGGEVSAGFGAVWIGPLEGPSYYKIDSITHETSVLNAKGQTSGPTLGPDALWVGSGSTSDSRLERVDPLTFDSQTIKVSGDNSYAEVGDDGALWLLNYQRTNLERIDPDSLKVDDFPVPSGVGTFAIAGGALWWFNAEDPGRGIAYMDLVTREVQHLGTGSVFTQNFIQYDGLLWFLNADQSEVVAIDPRQRAVVRQVGIGIGAVSRLVLANDMLWMVANDFVTVVQVDPSKGRVRRFKLGHQLWSATGTRDEVWATTASDEVVHARITAEWEERISWTR